MSATVGQTFKAGSVIPRNVEPVVAGGKTFFQLKKGIRKKFKLTKQQRDKLSRAAKKFKLPVAFLAVNGVPIIGLLDFIMKDLVTDTPFAFKQQAFVNKFLSWYLPIEAPTVSAGGAVVKFKPSGKQFLGLGGNALLIGARRVGAMRSMQNDIRKLSGGLAKV